MDIHNLKSEVEKLESTEVIDSAQAATATLHKDWLETKSGDVSVQESLSNLLSPKAKVKFEKQLRAQKAFGKYHEQGEPRKSDH